MAHKENSRNWKNWSKRASVRHFDTTSRTGRKRVAADEISRRALAPGFWNYSERNAPQTWLE
jgi:hypothetical protein